MSILHHAPGLVQPVLGDPATLIDELEAAAGVSPPPAPEWTDRAWLEAEADAAQARHDAGLEADTGVWACVAGEAAFLSRRMGRARHDSAVSFAADRATFSPDLGDVRLPPPGSRGCSALARALDVQAAWYLHLDAAAGALLAHHLLIAADQAEDYGADDAEELELLRDAYWRAAADAVHEVLDARRGAFDPSEL